MPRDFIPAAKPIIGALERSAVDAVIASGMVVQGPQVAAFEEEFAEQVVGGVYAVAVNSGTWPSTWRRWPAACPRTPR